MFLCSCVQLLWKRTAKVRTNVPVSLTGPRLVQQWLCSALGVGSAKWPHQYLKAVARPWQGGFQHGIPARPLQTASKRGGRLELSERGTDSLAQSGIIWDCFVRFRLFPILDLWAIAASTLSQALQYPQSGVFGWLCPWQPQCSPLLHSSVTVGKPHIEVQNFSVKHLANKQMPSTDLTRSNVAQLGLADDVAPVRSRFRVNDLFASSIAMVRRFVTTPTSPSKNVTPRFWVHGRSWRVWALPWPRTTEGKDTSKSWISKVRIATCFSLLSEHVLLSDSHSCTTRVPYWTSGRQH